MTPNPIRDMYAFEKLHPHRQASPAPSTSRRSSSRQVPIQLPAVLIAVALLLAGISAFLVI